MAVPTRTRRRRRGDPNEKAVQRGLPVYTEGVRLLVEGLRMLTSPAKQALADTVDRQFGRGLWNSPFTACAVGDTTLPADTARVEFDVSVASPA